MKLDDCGRTTPERPLLHLKSMPQMCDSFSLYPLLIKGHGIGTGVPLALGLRAGGRAHLGQNEPTAKDHQNRADRPLVEPRERTLLSKIVTNIVACVISRNGSCE